MIRIGLIFSLNITCANSQPFMPTQQVSWHSSISPELAQLSPRMFDLVIKSSTNIYHENRQFSLRVCGKWLFNSLQLYGRIKSVKCARHSGHVVDISVDCVHVTIKKVIKKDRTIIMWQFVKGDYRVIPTDDDDSLSLLWSRAEQQNYTKLSINRRQQHVIWIIWKRF